MERRQVYCSLPSNKNRHDEVRWASSPVPASPNVLDWGPGLCVSACQTHQTRHELGERLFSFFSNPTRRHLAQLCTSEASPQSLVSRQLSVIWKTTGLKAARLSVPWGRITENWERHKICSLHWQGSDSNSITCWLWAWQVILAF